MRFLRHFSGKQLLLPQVICSYVAHVPNKCLTQCANCFCTSPVALQFGSENAPCNGCNACLYHTMDGHFMRFYTYTTRCIRNGIYFISFTGCLDGGKCQTDLCPKGGHHHF